MAVASNSYLEDVKNTELDYIENNWTYVAWGSGATTVSASNTTLEKEFLRLIRQEVSDITNGKVISGYMGSGTGNGNTIRNVGIFKVSSGGTVQFSANLPIEIDKTSDTEYWSDISPTVNVTQS